VECCHGVTNATSPIVGIIPEPGSGQISSIYDFGSLYLSAADCAGADILAAPASYTTDDSTDFRANRHPDGG
jgi:hypothetical protein